MRLNMKWVLAGVSLVALVGLTAVQARGGVGGTAHDLSGNGWGTDQICKPCHTPHNANGSAGAPLWNHTVTSATFTLYSSPTLNATMGQPVGVSKLCLSCHDGTVAMDSFPGGSNSHTMTGDAMLGTNLSNDHPISFDYNAALVALDPGLKDPATTGLPLYNGKLECATCHDVHNNTLDPFLRSTVVGSALCLKCHNK